MAVSLKHTFQSTVPDGGDTSLVRPSDWNAEHTLTLDTGKLIGRSTAGAGAAEEISIGTGLSLSGGTLSNTQSTTLTPGTTATSGGAAGQIMFDTGSVLQESSNLVWNNTNGGLTVSSIANPTIPSLTINGASNYTGSTLSGVQITGTAGQFSCNPTTLTVGEFVTISGTLGGTGSITGYANPTTYRISATNGTTTFTLVNATTGAALTTTSGTPTGLTYTVTDPFINLSQTWNNSNVAFTGLRYNVTDTASNVNSSFLDLQVGGVSRFIATKKGSILFQSRFGGTGTSTTAFFDYANNGGLISGFGNGAGGYYFGGTDVNAVTVLAASSAGNVGGNIGFGTQPVAYSPTSTYSTITSSIDTYIRRKAAANIQLGAADAAAPVAQTLSVQSVVAGTSNTAGANLTITGSQGTGTGAGGSIIFQTAPAGTTGTAQNALSTALTIEGNAQTTIGLSNDYQLRVSPNTVSQGISFVGFGTPSFRYTQAGFHAFYVGSGVQIGFASSANVSTNGPDIILTRRGAANLRFGAADAAAPVAQTLSVQSVVAGTSNTAGANLTITGSQGTGTGAGGSIIFQVAPPGSSGTAQNALANGLAIFTGSNNASVTALVGSSANKKIAFGAGTNASYMEFDNSNSFLILNASNTNVGLGNGTTSLAVRTDGISIAGTDTILTRRGAANLRLGAADAAAPVAQTLSVQSVVAGTSNTAGANLTITGSQGTGTGAGGDIIFQTADVGASGTAQNTLVTALRIYSNQTVAVGKAYTVATLPAAGTQGRRAWVTDATAPTFLGALTGGGAVVCPVFDDGTAWVAG